MYVEEHDRDSYGWNTNQEFTNPAALTTLADFTATDDGFYDFTFIIMGSAGEITNYTLRWQKVFPGTMYYQWLRVRIGETLCISLPGPLELKAGGYFQIIVRAAIVGTVQASIIWRRRTD